MATAYADKADRAGITTDSCNDNSSLARTVGLPGGFVLRSRTANPSSERLVLHGHVASSGWSPTVPKWLSYSLLSLVCWTAWALTARIGSAVLPASAMQFISALGFLVVSFAVARVTQTVTHTSRKGKVYSVICGVLLALGGLASFAAYRSGESTAATTGITSLYPVITVVLALGILKERLTKLQIAGLFLSAIAIVLLSF